MKIGVLLSGGVDSSAALMTLVEQGHRADITAYYLKIWLEDELSSLGACPWEEDLEYARAVCESAGVPLKVLSLQREYWDRVVSYTVSELKAGRTPSPDVFCNRRVKFGAFLERVSEDLDKVASGHYATVAQGTDGFFRISRSPDPVKDQTYFLSQMTQDQVAIALFPIGSMMKDEVRRRAEYWNLANKSRKDSQGICFLGKIPYNEFVRHYLGEQHGPIVERETGKILGSHNGTWFYTIGQRSGLGLSGGPWYVVEKRKDENTVFVSGSPGAINAARRGFTVVKPNWIAEEPEDGRVTIKLRHGPKLIPAVIRRISHHADGSTRLAVEMDEADRGVAPGQFSVFYREDVLLGGAMIEESESP